MRDLNINEISMKKACFECCGKVTRSWNSEREGRRRIQFQVICKHGEREVDGVMELIARIG